jgi:hypothetical protein
MTHGKEKAVIETIDRTYGIATSDTAALKEMMNKLSKNIFQSESYVYQQNDDGVLAEDNHGSYMLEQGTFMLIMTKMGILSMTKDKRFHFANAGASDELMG